MKKGKPVKTVRPYIAAVPATNDAEEIPAQEGGEEIDEDVLKAWEDNNSKALGNIFLRLSPDIQAKHKTEEDAGALYQAIEEEYGKPGVMGVYSEFKSALDIQIPANADPIPAIDKILAHFGRLAEAQAEIPDFIKAMMILTRMPPSYDYLAQIICQADNIDNVNVAELRKMVKLA
jgi:hypothetical protein